MSTFLFMPSGIRSNEGQRMFENFETLQSRSQSQRFQVYQLLNELMLNHRAGMFYLCVYEGVGLTD